MKIDHIGYLVRNITKSAAQLEVLGFNPISDPYYDENRDADIQFLDNGGYRIELVAPRSDKSIVWKLLKKCGSTPYHICYATEHMEEALSQLSEMGTSITSPPAHAPALGNHNVAFLYSRHLGVIELLEVN